MNKNKKILLIILFAGFVFHLFAQSHNPFEVYTRKADSPVVNTKNDSVVKNESTVGQSQETKVLTHSQNPFEIYDSNSDAKSSSGVVPAKEVNKTKSSKPDLQKYKNQGNESFLLWLFLFILAFIAILLSINRYLIMKLIKAVWYHNLTNILFRNFFNRDFVLYISLAIIFILNFSIFLYLLSRKYFGLSGMNIYLYILAGVTIMYVVKHLSIYIFVKIFSEVKNLIVYNFTVLLFSITIGIILLPINLLIAYSLESVQVFFIYLGIIIISFLYFFRLFRGFLATYTYVNNSIFHFFLYLCAFEILPLLAVYRFVMNLM